jgi:hypothetical protein
MDWASPHLLSHYVPSSSFGRCPIEESYRSFGILFRFRDFKPWLETFLAFLSRVRIRISYFSIICKKNFPDLLRENSQMSHKTEPSVQRPAIPGPASHRPSVFAESSSMRRRTTTDDTLPPPLEILTAPSGDRRKTMTTNYELPCSSPLVACSRLY